MRWVVTVSAIVVAGALGALSSAAVARGTQAQELEVPRADVASVDTLCGPQRAV